MIMGLNLLPKALNCYDHAADLKTADGKLSVSSNLTASAIFKALIYQGFFIFRQ